MSQVRISVVIPVHNESAKLEQFFQTFINTLKPELSQTVLEIILVENGSTDSTWEVCQSMARKAPNLIRALQSPRASYGEAIRLGMRESAFTHVSILECDLLEPRFLRDSLQRFELGAQFVVGSKRHPDATDLRPAKRRILTMAFNYLLRVFLGYPGTDTHGLKSIEGALAKKLCDLCITSDEVFQTELVLLAWRLGAKIEEVPVHIHERRPTPVSIWRRFPKVVKMVFELRRSLRRFPPRPHH